MPKECTKGQHLFTYTNTLDLGDTAWAFNNDKKGVYFFWDEDTSAYASGDTASTFSGGILALAGLGGLIAGVAGSSAIFAGRRRKEKEPAAQTETTA